jgi:hypothetical protein
MAIFSLMRLSRIQRILEVEPLFKDEMALPKLRVSGRSGSVMDEVVPFSIQVCRALIERGNDPHNADRELVIACAASLKNGEIKASDELPPAILAVASSRRKEPQKRPIPKQATRMKTTEEILNEQHAMLSRAIKELDVKILDWTTQREKLNVEYLQLDLLRRVIAEGRIGDVNELLATERPAAQAPVEQAPTVANRQKFTAAELKPRLVEVLTTLKESGEFRLRSFKRLWTCDRSAVYVREFAKALPEDRPLLQDDGVTFVPSASAADVLVVAEAICAEPWPKYISKHTFDEVRAMARENILKISRNGLVQKVTE